MFFFHVFCSNNQIIVGTGRFPVAAEDGFRIICKIKSINSCLDLFERRIVVVPKFCCLSDGFMLVTDAENTFASAAVGDVKICIVFKCVNNI